MHTALKTMGRRSLKLINRFASAFDRTYLADGIPNDAKPAWNAFVQSITPGKRILEIGSREVTGPSKWRETFAGSEYVGFDYYPGRNVDVVGDVHQLSSYFVGQDQFDVVYSAACFEHFAMPWIVAVEIAKVLKVGGILFIATHFSFKAHERPWNFFQFSDMGLRVLFPEALGFECIATGMSDPIVGRFSALADSSVRYQPIRGLYCGSEYFGRKVRDVQSFDWSRLSLAEVVGKTVYPAPTDSSGEEPNFAPSVVLSKSGGAVRKSTGDGSARVSAGEIAGSCGGELN